MDVAAHKSGDEPVGDEGSRVRLNIALCVATVLLLGVTGVVLVALANGHRLPGQDPSGSSAEAAPGAGRDVGRGLVEAVSAASTQEQQRVADQLEAASRMVTAFVNFDYRDADATTEAVRSMATGDFLAEYSAGAADLEQRARRARSRMVARVVGTGLVTGDDDSATVIVATSGSVRNRTTKFEDEARSYRIQVQLVRKDGRWLTSDLQYVALGGGGR